MVTAYNDVRRARRWYERPRNGRTHVLNYRLDDGGRRTAAAAADTHKNGGGAHDAGRSHINRPPSFACGAFFFTRFVTPPPPSSTHTHTTTRSRWPIKPCERRPHDCYTRWQAPRGRRSGQTYLYYIRPRASFSRLGLWCTRVTLDRADSTAEYFITSMYFHKS